MNLNINKELSVLIFGRFIQILIMLVALKVSTSLLSPSAIGNLYLILSIYSFFGFFFISPIGQYINRKTHEWHKNGLLLSKLYNYNYYVLIASSISVLVIIVIHHLGIANGINYTLLILFMPVYVFFNTWNQTIIPMVNMLEKRKEFTIMTILTLIIALAFSYILVEWYEKSGIFWFLGQIFGSIIMTIVSFIYFNKNIDNKIDFALAHSWIRFEYVKSILIFAVPLAISVFFLWMQNQSYRIVIEKNIGADFLGYFGVGMAIAIAISSSFEAIIMQFIYPKLYKSMNSDKEFNNSFHNTINLILPIYLLLAIFISFSAEYLVAILVDVKYYSSYVFVIFGIWVEFFRISSNLLSTIAHSKMQTFSLILPYSIGGLVLLGGVLYVSKIDTYATAIPFVLVFAGILTFAFMYFQMNKIIKIKIEFSNIFRVIIYSLGFVPFIFFYDFSEKVTYSLLFVVGGGFYFLFLLNKLVKKSGAI